MTIKAINFKDLNKCEGCIDEFNIILYDKPNIVYYGLVDKGSILSIMAVEKVGEHYKFRANYTPEKFRKRGYNSHLLSVLCSVFSDKSIVTEANDWSMPIYKKMGFEITGQRKCKYWTKYFMRREGNGKTENRD